MRRRLEPTLAPARHSPVDCRASSNPSLMALRSQGRFGSVAKFSGEFRDIARKLFDERRDLVDENGRSDYGQRYNGGVTQADNPKSRDPRPTPARSNRETMGLSSRLTRSRPKTASISRVGERWPVANEGDRNPSERGARVSHAAFPP